MKPEPSSSSDGQRPRRQPRAAEEKRPADELEADLWDLDESTSPPKTASPGAEKPTLPERAEPGESPEDSPPAAIQVVPRNSRRDVGFKQSTAKSFTPKKTEPSGNPETEGDFSKRINSSTTVDRRPVDDAFDDLETSLASHPGLDEEAPPPTSEAVEADTEKASIPPQVKILSSGLSKTERIGLIAFLVLLAAGLLFFLAYSVNKLPDEQKHLTSGDLPIKGGRLEAVKIESYWRAPLATGTTTENVRRGTLLLPVVELGVNGGPAAIRIFFRDSDGATVGDGVTRPVNGAATLTVAATAGFDDAGMFAAYRTGDSKPWFIEVYEGPSVDAAGSDFKKLFEIPISTRRR